MKKERLDKVLVDTGLVKSRERAKALIMEGKVSVSGLPALKAGSLVDPGSSIVLKEDDIPFVGRGGVKLEGAIEHFSVELAGKVVMDVGCSTGGFTDCVLKKNARNVYAIDVGYGQFDWSLRNDPRVILMEKTNIRYLEQGKIGERIDCAVIDVSFISLLKVLPAVREFLAPEGIVLALIKPQFEVGRGQVGKGGIVKDEADRLAAVDCVKQGAEALGFHVQGVVQSSITGQKGNVEYFIYLKRG
ncbi:MAG: TlyA family rRNA (cytidine-2'-O)-methyltransferase [Thermodesulfovibrio sp.]|nr:TlyA family rRNA (cytidine-2'-O)-methyltransferase [Thermodesulfovibrio sp.]